MAEYRDLNAQPKRALADVVAELREQARSSKTGAAGVKDFGEHGDAVWTDADGEQQSVRAIPSALEQLKGELATGIATASKFNTVATTTPVETDGYPEGAFWTIVDFGPPMVEADRWQLVEGIWVQVGLDAGRLVAGTVDAGLIDAVALAARMVTSGLIRTAESGQRVVIDSNGLVMYGLDPDGAEYEMVRLGPSGEQLLTIGSSTISEDSVAAPRGAFDALTVGGNSLDDLLWGLPRGVRAWGTLSENSKTDASNTFVRRAELQTTLEPDRLYRVKVNSRYLYNTGSQTTYVTDVVHYSFDATPILPNNLGSGVTQGFSGRHYLPTGTYYTAPALEFMVDTSGQNGDRVFWTMYSYRTHNMATPVYIVAGSTNPIAMSIEDVGPSMPRTLKRWNDGDGGGSQDPAPIVTRRTATWDHGGFGGDTRGGNVYQGSYSSYGNRYGGWLFSSAMRSALSGSTIEKFEVYLENTHWYYGAGGTARIVPNDGAYKGVNFGNTAVLSANWPRYAGRWVTLPAAWYPHIASGTYRGVSTYATSSSLTYYGQFRGAATRFRATYRK
ncbi:MAG TPA: hypothetical protein K8W24_15980 [Brachybacterium paraconglomeratum]|uniref:Minor tail protein n=1 Tax=Brachybacterium paraconglomeratum TaxID=173362 RepID=A0A921KS07_9MICO|nr:hypothetical protein [Brachybacterium paraconglomeratum]